MYLSVRGSCLQPYLNFSCLPCPMVSAPFSLGASVRVRSSEMINSRLGEPDSSSPQSESVAMYVVTTTDFIVLKISSWDDTL